MDNTQHILNRNNYKITGQEYDVATGLYNFRARHFDTDLGMFCAADPAGSSTSPYGYAMSNPISFVDATGMIAQGEGGAAGIPLPFYTYHPIFDNNDVNHLDLLNLGFSSEEIYMNPENWDYTGAINPAGNILETGLSPSSSSGNPMMSYDGNYIAAQYAVNPTVMSGSTIPNLSSNWSSNAGPQGLFIPAMADYSSVNRHGGGGGYNPSITPTVQNGGIIERTGSAINAAGIITSSHYALYYNSEKYGGWVMGNWNGKNIWYGINGANQYKMSAAKALENVKYLKGFGVGISALGIIISGGQTWNTINNSNNKWERVTSVLDLESNVTGAALGPIGAAFNGGYTFGRYAGRYLVKFIYNVNIR